MSKYKVIVAGGRDYFNSVKVGQVIFSYAESLGPDTYMSIVSGMAKGADLLGWSIAKQHNIVCHEFPADWNKYGKSAGYKRNEEMAEFADALIAFWDGQSRGTKHMINIMEKLGKPVTIIRY